VNDSESQGTYWVNMPDFASSVNSVQIQRGVGTSTNGAGAFGGSVNMQTNQFEAKPYAEINASGGSFGTLKTTLKVGSGLLGNKFTVDGRLSRIVSDGYIDRASSNLQAAYLSAAYFGQKSFVRVNYFLGKEKTFQSWYGTPESRINGSESDLQAYIDRNYLSSEEATNLLKSGRTYNYYTYPNQTDNYAQDHLQLF
jgi:iron complex outermembrane receptor protein